MSTTSIITVNYNQPEVTLALLNSIKKNCSVAEIEVILVDNASEVDHENLFMDCYPALRYIRSEVNLGFAGGNNLGIKQAKGEYILMVNNDTELIAGFTEELVAEMIAHPEIGILSPLILFYDDPDIIQYAGFTPMNFRTGRNSTIGLKSFNTGQYSHTSQPTAYCHGAAMMCRRSDIGHIGLMPEQYFLYYEELDWCEMFKRAGKKIWFSGKTHILHKESMSVGKDSPIKTYFIARNRFLFIRRNTNLLNRLLFGTYYLLMAVPKELIKYILKGRFELITPFLRAVLWNFAPANEPVEPIPSVSAHISRFPVG